MVQSEIQGELARVKSDILSSVETIVTKNMNTLEKLHQPEIKQNFGSNASLSKADVQKLIEESLRLNEGRILG